MKIRAIQTCRCAVSLLLLSLILPVTVRAGQVSPCNPAWYAVPNDPAWGWPPTLGDMLPLPYRDTECVFAYFLVPLDQLESLLPQGVHALAADMAPSPWSKRDCAVHLAGSGVLVVGFLNHRSVDWLGPYYEELVGVMVDDRSSKDGYFPVYVTSMTLTSLMPVLGGIAGWGFPKMLGDVQMESVEPKGLKCFCSVEDELIMKMEVATDDLVEATVAPFMLLTTKEGYLVRTAWVSTGTQYASFSLGKSVIKLGQHPIARQLRDIGLEMAPSIGLVWADHLDSKLPAGMCELLPSSGGK